MTNPGPNEPVARCTHVLANGSICGRRAVVMGTSTSAEDPTMLCSKHEKQRAEEIAAILRMMPVESEV